MIPPRFPVSKDEIAAVVAEFYASVRQNPVLGPVFARHVTDWPAHEEKVARFWQNAILHARVYDGNPLEVHRAAGNVRPGMFQTWLRLFDETLHRRLPRETAAAWSALAHRIGQGLIFGLLHEKGPPKLR